MRRDPECDGEQRPAKCAQDNKQWKGLDRVEAGGCRAAPPVPLRSALLSLSLSLSLFPHTHARTHCVCPHSLPAPVATALQAVNTVEFNGIYTCEDWFESPCDGGTVADKLREIAHLDPECFAVTNADELPAAMAADTRTPLAEAMKKGAPVARLKYTCTYEQQRAERGLFSFRFDLKVRIIGTPAHPAHPAHHGHSPRPHTTAHTRAYPRNPPHPAHPVASHAPLACPSEPPNADRTAATRPACAKAMDRFEIFSKCEEMQSWEAPACGPPCAHPFRVRVRGRFCGRGWADGR